jgi:glyoxylate carboligase
MTVIEHVLSRLQAIGITDIFGVPGDYAFPVNDAICNHPDMNWIGCSNELNAAYAADGYARVKGVSALCTTYGVGELSAINGIAGAYAEHLPVFHLVGMPNMPVQSSRALMHHTLGNGEYHLFQRMTEPVVCASAVMTPQNVAYETERLIAEALYHRRPVYMAFPADLANQSVVSEAQPIAAPHSDSSALADAVEAIAARLEVAKAACVLPGILVARTGSKQNLQDLIDTTNVHIDHAIPFVDFEFVESGKRHHARIIHHYVNSSISFQSELDKLPDVLKHRHIQSPVCSSAALLPQCLGECFQTLSAPCPEDNPSALSAKHASCCFTDAAAGACDENYFVLDL